MEGGETVRSIYQTITCGGLALALCLALLPAPEAGAACSSIYCSPVATHSYFGAAGDGCTAVAFLNGGYKSARVVGTNAHFFNPVAGQWSACAPAANAASAWTPIGAPLTLYGMVFHFAGSALPAACSFQFRPLAGPGSAPATETCVVSGSNGLPVELLSFRAE
jgi:hypothetical protein